MRQRDNEIARLKAMTNTVSLSHRLIVNDALRVLCVDLCDLCVKALFFGGAKR
jgi:hypothetical protein